jgi:hypothetical protein
LAEASEGFAQVCLLALAATRAAGVEATKVYATGEAEAKITGTGGPASRLIGDVILHAGTRVYFHLSGIDRSSQSRVECAGILTITVAERVVNVLFRSIYA